MTPQVSVVIPTYNRAGVLKRAIRSVQTQSFHELEIIVVDDGSTDSTASLLDQFDDPRLRLIQHETNRGAPAARNTGIHAAEAPLVAFLDSDDVWAPDKLEAQYEETLAPSPADIVITGNTVYRDGRPLKTQYTAPLNGRIWDALLRHSVGTTSSLLARRSCLLAANGFDESLSGCQDWDLLLRMAPNHRIKHLPTPLVRVHRHTDTPSISSRTESILQSRLQIFEKHQDLIQSGGTEVQATHYLQIGKLYCEIGQTETAREYFRKAMIHRPWTIRLLLHQAASLLGSSAYQKLVSLRQWAAGQSSLFRPEGPHDLGLPGRIDPTAT